MLDQSHLELPAPITPHETHGLLDASKIQAFMDSPRRYFYTYILGWQPVEPNIHLVFGSAWHEAMEIMMQEVGNYNDEQVVLRAWNAFNEVFLEGGIDPMLDMGGKTPENALTALIQYAKQYQYDNFKTLYTEIAFTISVGKGRILHGKMDSVVEEKDGSVWSIEHKTTGRKTSSWVDKWPLIPQTWLYSHAIKAMYGEKGRGIKINGSVLRKGTNEHLRVPVKKSNPMMQAGLESINHWVDQIEWNMERLTEDSADNPTMYSFPCNSMSCTKFSCPFSHFCAAWPNPLQRVEVAPVGFEKSFWDPRRIDDKERVHMAIGKEEVEV